MKRLLLGLSIALALPVMAMAQTNTAPSANISNAVTAGLTFQTLIGGPSSGRRGCMIQNPTTATEVLYVNFGALASATVDNSYSLAAGASINCASPGGLVISDPVNVMATTTGHKFTANAQ